MVRFFQKASLIVDNSIGLVYLQFRTFREDIPYPNYWGLFDGRMNVGENAQQCITRMAEEKIGYCLSNPQYLGYFPFVSPDGVSYNTHVFFETEPELLFGGLRLKPKEGKGKFFTHDEVDKTELAFNGNRILRDYYKKMYGW